MCIEGWSLALSTWHANASPSYNARVSRVRIRRLSKSTNRTSCLIYGFCKPCTVIGLSRRRSGETMRTECEIIQERQIEFRRAYLSGRLDLKISFVVIIISMKIDGKHARLFCDCFDIIPLSFQQSEILWITSLLHSMIFYGISVAIAIRIQ